MFHSNSGQDDLTNIMFCCPQKGGFMLLLDNCVLLR